MKNENAAAEAFEKIDVKRNLGLDYYQFETHVRTFVLELVQPMLEKAEGDHSITSRLDNEFESIRQRLETLTFETTKTLKKAVSQNEF